MGEAENHLGYMTRVSGNIEGGRGRVRLRIHNKGQWNIEGGRGRVRLRIHDKGQWEH